MIEGYFYLHVNKELIYKNNPDAIIDIRESDLCHSAWAWDSSRLTAWNILVEALSLGAKEERIDELASKWNITNEDAVNYANFLGLDIEENKQHQASYKDITGYGKNYLYALADLCKKVGYTGGKMWNKTFKDFVNKYE